MTDQTETEDFEIELDEETAALVTEQAEACNMPVEDYVVQLLKNYIAELNEDAQ